MECVGVYGIECISKTTPKILYGTCKADAKCEWCLRLMIKDAKIKGYTFPKAIKELSVFEVVK